MKKTLSFLLCITIMMSTFSISAFANETIDEERPLHEEQLQLAEDNYSEEEPEIGDPQNCEPENHDSNPTENEQFPNEDLNPTIEEPEVEVASVDPTEENPDEQEETVDDISIMSDTANGTCGTNLTWELNDDGVLTISGAGTMNDYTLNYNYSTQTHSSTAPWFRYAQQINAINIQKGVTYIGNNAFYGLSSLTSVYIPDTITKIGSSSFNGCININSLYIEDIVAWCNINHGLAISNASGITLYIDSSPISNLVIPDGVTKIPDNAFSGVSSLTSVKIHDGVTSIGKEAFRNCTSLADINIPETVTSLGKNAFTSCTSITSITIPKNAEIVDSNSFFSGCTNLVTVTINSFDTYIDNNAFANCSSLKKLIINGSLGWVCWGAFSGCSKLESMTIPEGQTEIEGYTFEDCTSLKTIYIPKSIEFIASGAFYNCPHLKTIYYAGKSHQWAHIDIDSGNEDLLSADLVANHHIHQFELHNCKEPTCTELGYSGDRYCTICEKVVEKGKTINALGHASILQDALAATEDHDGYSGDLVCTRCGELLQTGHSIPMLSIASQLASPADLHFNNDYMLLQRGEIDSLKIYGIDENWLPYIDFDIDTKGYMTGDIIALSSTEEANVFNVIASNLGSAVVTVSVMDLDGTVYSAQCRIDVIDDTPEEAVAATSYKVSLPVTKATVEVFSTDYARIPVLLNIQQNADDSVDVQGSNLVSPRPELPEDDGVAIVRAEFAGEAASYFDLKVADDRSLLVVPKTETLTIAESTPKIIKNTQKSQIRVYIGETETPIIANETLTLTVKKTLPKIKAKAVKFNSFLESDNQKLDFSGLKMSLVELDSSKSNPTWLVLNDDQSVSFNTEQYANTKQSGTLNLLVCPEGWAIKVPVAVSVSAALTRPKLSLKPNSLSLNPVGSDAVSTDASLSPAEFVGNDQCRILVLDFKEGKNNYDLMHHETWPINLTIDGVGISVTPGAAMPTDGKAHTYKITLGTSYAGNPAANDPAKSSAVLTVKLLPKKDAALTLKATGTIDLAIPKSPVTITPTLKNVGGPVQYVITAITDAYGMSTLDYFNVDELTLTAKNGLATGKYTATVKATYGIGENECVTKTTNFTVKRSTTIPTPIITLKAKGNIDVIRPQSTITLIPTFKNWYARTLEIEDLHIYRQVSKGNYEDETGLFDVKLENNVYTVKTQNGISHLNKYYACIKSDDINGGKDGKMTALSVKMGAAKFYQSAKSVMLLKHDRFSTAAISLATADANLSSITKVVPDAKSAKLFDIKLLQSGEVIIAYKDSKFTTTKTTTVKLNVFLDGNYTVLTAKPKANATISIKVNFG